MAVIPSSFFMGAVYYGNSLATKTEGITVMSWQKKRSTLSFPRRLVYGLLCSGLMTVWMCTVPSALLSAVSPVSPCSKPLKTNFLGVRVTSQVATIAMSVVEVVETEQTEELVPVETEPVAETTTESVELVPLETEPVAVITTEPAELVPVETEPVAVITTETAELVPVETDMIWEPVHSVPSEIAMETGVETVMVSATVELVQTGTEAETETETETDTAQNLEPVVEPEITDIQDIPMVPHPEWEPLNPVNSVTLTLSVTTDPATKNELMLLIAAHYYNAGKYDDAARILKQLPDEWRKEFLRYVLLSSSPRLDALPYLERWVKTI